MEVIGDSVNFEMFTRWQGSWLPCVGEWTDSYAPQVLMRNEDGSLTNDNIHVQFKQGKNLRLSGTAEKTFAGKVKFNLEKQDELPTRYRKVKTRAIEFAERNKSEKTML